MPMAERVQEMISSIIFILVLLEKLWSANYGVMMQKALLSTGSSERIRVYAIGKIFTVLGEARRQCRCGIILPSRSNRRGDSMEALFAREFIDIAQLINLNNPA